MAVQELKVSLVYLVTLELVAHQDSPSRAHLDLQDLLDPKAQWVHLGSQV